MKLKPIIASAGSGTDDNSSWELANDVHGQMASFIDIVELYDMIAVSVFPQFEICVFTSRLTCCHLQPRCFDSAFAVDEYNFNSPEEKVLYATVKLFEMIVVKFGSLNTIDSIINFYVCLRIIEYKNNKDCLDDARLDIEPVTLHSLVYRCMLLWQSMTPLGFDLVDGQSRIVSCLFAMMGRRPNVPFNEQQSIISETG